MEPPITPGVRVRLVARVHQRPFVHRVDARHGGKKIRPLRNLELTRLRLAALGFGAQFTCAGEYLARDQKWQDARDKLVPWEVTANEVVVVATIAVAREICVVLEEAN